MYDIKKISVALVTYNGERFIKEQLLSIIHQTRMVDEIVVSDDGSQDNTLNIVRKISNSDDARGISFQIITDNPRHGCGGNIEWALKHTTGDIVFISGQDDIWLPEKVELVAKVFEEHEDALLVSHHADKIDEYGKKIQSDFLLPMNQNVTINEVKKGFASKVTVTVDQILSSSIVPGMTFSITRDFLKRVYRIPTFAEDQWIEFLAIIDDGYYFLNQDLTHYRKHQDNTSGSQSKGLKRIKKFFEIFKVKPSYIVSYLHMYEIGNGFVNRLKQKNMVTTDEYKVACRIFEIGTKKKDAFDKGRLRGSIALIKMYVKDVRYRRIGFWSFLQDYVFILKYGGDKTLIFDL